MPQASGRPRRRSPSIATLGRLAGTVRAAGLDVDLAITGQIRPLPPGLELSVYRIVQEALTNVLKHARASRARVRVGYGPDAVTVDVVDDGTARTATGAPGGAPAGHGLVGMRQRARVFGAPPRPARRLAAAGRCAPNCRPNPCPATCRAKPRAAT